MQKFVYHELDDKLYIGILIILDNEIDLQDCFSSLVPFTKQEDKKVLVDLAVRSGISNCRFVQFDINDDGYVNSDNSMYINNVNSQIIKLADKILSDMLDGNFSHTNFTSDEIKILQTLK